MIKEFKKFDDKAIKETIISVQELNEMLTKNNANVQILTRSQSIDRNYKIHEEANALLNCPSTPFDKYVSKYYNCSLEIVVNNEDGSNIPSIVRVGKALDITIKDWKWDSSGCYVILNYV